MDLYREKWEYLRCLEDRQGNINPSLIFRSISIINLIQYRLAHTLGRTTALDLLLTSKILSANDCLEMGIVQHIIPGKDILKEATEWLQPRVHLPTEVIRGYKDVISNAIHSTFYESLDYEMKRFTPFWGGDLNVNALTKRVKHVK